MPKRSTPADPSPIDIETHPRFQEMFWRLQRCAWAAFGLIVLAAVAGLGGAGGPFARQSHQTRDGVQIETPRIARWQTSVAISVSPPTVPHADQRKAPDRYVEQGSSPRARPRQAAPGATTVSVTTPFLEHFQVEEVHPAPEAAATLESGAAWRFLSPPGSAPLRFEIRPRKPGRVHYRIRVNDGPWTPITTLVLP